MCERLDSIGPEKAPARGDGPAAYLAAAALLVALAALLVALAPRREVEARRLVVRDALRRERVRIDVDPVSGDARLVLRDGRERARVVLTAGHAGEGGAYRLP